MEMPVKLATPATAASDSVPDSVPPAGLVPIESVTFPANVGTVLPTLSCAVTAVGASEGMRSLDETIAFVGLEVAA